MSSCLFTIRRSSHCILLFLKCMKIGGTFSYSYVGGSFCCNYAGDCFCKKNVGDNFHNNYAGENLCCN